MQVSSDKGRGTVIAVIVPVESLPLPMASRELSSRPNQLVYLYGFEGVGLTRLAGAISAQLASECTARLGPARHCYC